MGQKQFNLLAKAEIVKLEFSAQAGLIGRLQKARAESAMYLYSRRNNCSREELLCIAGERTGASKARYSVRLLIERCGDCCQV